MGEFMRQSAIWFCVLIMLLSGCEKVDGNKRDNYDTSTSYVESEIAHQTEDVPALSREELLCMEYGELESKFKKFQEKYPKLYDDYDLLSATVIERFLDYGVDDINNGDIKRSQYVLEKISNMFSVLEMHTFDIAKGITKPRTVPRFVTGKLHSDGKTLRNLDGDAVLLAGYGHFMQVRLDIPYMPSFGCNLIQIEFGPSFILHPLGTFNDDEIMADPNKFRDGDFDVDLNPFIESVCHYLEIAAEHNVRVDLLISPHYYPQWMYDVYPQTKTESEAFLEYDIYSEATQKMLDVYIEAIIPLIKNSPSLNGICLSNEPQFTAAHSAHGQRLWQEHLIKKFSTVDGMNKAWSTEYDSFDEVASFPDVEASPPAYEYYKFNNELFAKWHEDLAKRIQKIAPEIPLHSKIMSTMNSYQMISNGAEPILFSSFSDYSGNDSWAFLGSNKDTIRIKLAWYDLLGSIKNIPIINSEDHFIQDGNIDYTEGQAAHVYTDIFQGGMHGRSMTTAWVWERTHDSDSVFAGGILHRPDCVEAFGRATLDLNRLSEIVAMFQNKKPEIGILYLFESKLYNSTYAEIVAQSYNAVISSGHQAGFVTEATLSLLDELEYLVIPGITHLTDEVFSYLESYRESGGQLLILNHEGIFGFNEYEKPFPENRINALVSGSKSFNVRLDNTKHGIQAILRDELLKIPRADGVSIIHHSHEGDIPLSSAEWRVINENGYNYLSLTGYHSYNLGRTISLTVNGEPIKNAIDLISGEAIDGTFKFLGLSPMLIRWNDLT